jgi:integrase
MAKLTDLKVKNAKPEATRQYLSDNGSGLYLAIQPSGHKSFVTFLRLKGGKQIKVTHGEAGVMTLHDARERNAAAIKQAKLGNDPRAEKKQAKINQQATQANSFAAVAEMYLGSNKVRNLRSVKQYRDNLHRLAFPHIGDRPITEIKRSEVIKALDHIERHSGARSADVALSAIRCVMNFYAIRDEDYRSPLVKNMGRVDPDNPGRKPRKLADDEIRKLWASGNRFVRFLLLTGCRRSEAAKMKWREVTGNMWLLPAARNKVKLDLTRPLSDMAIDALGERGEDDDFVFSNSPGKPMCSFSRIKKRLDKASGVTGWCWHDLRHTAKSLMSRAQVPSDHSEQALGHVLPGLKGRYDHHDFIAERGRALETLAGLLRLIIDPPPVDVPDLNAERQKRRARP